MPTFAETYPLGSLLPVLIAPLLVVTAAQLGSAPLVDLETWHVMVSPLAVTLLALPVLPLVRSVLDPGKKVGGVERSS